MANVASKSIKLGSVAAGLILLTGCGSSSSSKASPATTAASGGATTAGSAKSSPTTAKTGTAVKPVVTVPDTPAPATLQITDLTVGTGAEAKSGQTVSVEYVGVAYSTKKEFDSSWGKRPFSFQLGHGDVIEGWDLGVAGMKVGGRRQLVIPPSQGYGAQGAGGAIGPNETLVFVVDLLSVS